MAFSFLLCLQNKNKKKKEIWQIRVENKGEGGAGPQGATHTVR